VVIVGTKGSGKSTFISRFFNSVLPSEVAKDLVVIKLDLKGSTGDSAAIVGWLDDLLLQEAENSVFSSAPTYDQLRGIFYDEYVRLRVGSWANQYKNDREGFRQKFGEWMEDERQRRPHVYIEGMLRFVVRSERKIPVIVFDNADHFDIGFQQQVYQYARSLYEKTVCLIVLPITDRTSWQLSKHGALQSFDHQAFFLPTPSAEQIIRKRIDFLELRIKKEREKPSNRYFVKQGIYLSIEDIANFTRTLQRVFLQTSIISSMIGDLANHDVRRALNLTRSFVMSPHLEIEDLISAYIAGTAVEVPLFRATRALVRGQYDIYPVGQNDYVQNLFALNSDLTTTPLLGARILQMLSDVPVNERNEALVEVDQVVGYFSSAGVEARATNLWLDAMLKTGLCLSYDPTVQVVAPTLDIEISPSGRLHLGWAVDTFEYLGAMGDVTPLLTESTYQLMHDVGRGRSTSVWRRKIAAFVMYLLGEDDAYFSLPQHAAYEGQVRLRKKLEGLASLLAREIGELGKF
jgi:GTPase SAR1 family protein